MGVACFRSPITATAAWALRLFVILLVSFGGDAFAQGLSPTTFQLPLDRAGHSFTLRQGDITRAVDVLGITNLTDDGMGNLSPSANSFLEIRGDVTDLETYWLIDETTGGTTPPNIWNSPTWARHSFLSSPWILDWEVSKAFFVSLPESRLGHVFSVFWEGVSHTLTTGPLLSYSTTDSNGEPRLASYGFFEGSAPTGPGNEYVIVDQTAMQQSDNRPVTNRDLVSSTTWTPFSGNLPTKLLTIWLADKVGSGYFAARYDLNTLSGYSQRFEIPIDELNHGGSGGFLRLGTTAMGMNEEFQLTRLIDGHVTNTRTIGITNREIMWLMPHIGEVLNIYREIPIRVGESYFEQTIYLRNAHDFIFWHIDIGLHNLVHDPGYSGLEIAAGDLGPQNAFRVSGSQNAYDSQGNVYYSYPYWEYHYAVFQDPTVPFWFDVWSAGQFLKISTDLMDGYSPPPMPDYTPRPDFVQGSTQPISLNISATRWNHQLEVRTGYGERYPVTADRMQGFWSVDQRSQSWFTSYWYFNATSFINPGYDWRVVDLTTGEEAPQGGYDLSSWHASDANLDTDGDGLVDWYEKLIGLNHLNKDSDGDRMPDGWEIQHSFNPTNNTDAQLDRDADGFTNLREYIRGTDPFVFDPHGTWLNLELRLDPGRAGHSFSIEWNGATHRALSAGLIELASSSWTSLDADLDDTSVPSFSLIDHTAGERLALAGLTILEGVATPAGQWRDAASGALATRKYFLLPAARRDHQFALTTGIGSLYPVTVSPFTGQIYESYLGLAHPTQRVSGVATFDLNSDFSLIDLTTNERSPLNRTNLVPVAWVQNTVPLPFRTATIIVSDADARRSFSLSSQGSVQWLDPQLVLIGDNWRHAVVASLATGAAFVLARTEDWARSTQQQMGFEDQTFDFSTVFPAIGSPPVNQPPINPLVTIWLPASEAGNYFTLHTSSGTSYPVYPSGAGGFDEFGVFHSNPSVSARIAPNQNFWLERIVDNSISSWEWVGTADRSVDWTAEFSAVVPTDPILTIWLHPDNATTSFTLTTTSGSSDVFNPWWVTDYDSSGNSRSGFAISTTIGPNQAFTLTRNSSGVSASGSIGIVNLRVDWSAVFSAAVPPVVPPYQPKWESISFKVGENHYGHSILVHQADGTTITPSLDGNNGYRSSSNNGPEYRYYYTGYTARVDINQGYWIQDSSGHRDLMDGFNPPAPPRTGLSFKLPAWRAGHAFRLSIKDQGSQPVVVNAEPVDRYLVSGVHFSGTGDQQQVDRWVSYVTGTSSYLTNAIQKTYLVDETHGDRIAVYPGPNQIDLSQWWGPQQTLQLMMPASRWTHKLEVHTANGDVYSIQNGQMQGFWSATGPNDSSFTPYWIFDARSYVRHPVDWWVYDRDTNERAPMNQSNLATWVAANSETDSDGDGLVNWYESIIGTDPSKQDTDGDLLPDGWELARNLDPRDPRDGLSDRDGDRISNLREYQAHSNRNADTDGDGVKDWDEIRAGTNPDRPDNPVLNLSVFGFTRP